MTSSALAEFKKDPWQWQRQRMVLPEVTLAGPVELVFSRITDLSLYLPHSTDVPRARRLLVAPGAALTLRQLKGISLRKPVELPDLPAAYIAEVGHARVDAHSSGLVTPESRNTGLPAVCISAMGYAGRGTQQQWASRV